MPSALRRLPALVPLFVFLLPGCESSTEPLPIDDPDPEELVPVCATSVDAVSSFLGITGPGDDPLPAVDFFLKLDGIDGESQDSAHEGEIDILDFSFGYSVEVPTDRGGGGEGRATLGDLILVKELDKSSDALDAAAAAGTVIPEARFSVRTGTAASDYLVITLEDVLVTSVTRSDDSTDVPTEEMSLNFGKVEWDSEGEISCDGAGSALATFLGLEESISPMKIDGFLKVPDIPGDSQDPGHEDEIDLLSFSLNTRVHVEAGPAGAPASRAFTGELVVVKSTDSTSPIFRDAAATGTSYPNTVLSGRKTSDDEKVEYLTITLEDAIVVSYDTGAGGEEAPTESVSFTYQKIEWTWEG
jgi:type VI secretion system secreted protein Hcp